MLCRMRVNVVLKLVFGLAAHLSQAHQVTDDGEGWPIRVYTSSFLQEVIYGLHGIEDEDAVSEAMEEDQVT